MEGTPRSLKIPKSECPEIWICLPRHNWPKSWSKIEDPVVPPERNLYGHPLGGLSWERQFEEASLELAWQRAPNWECRFAHRRQGLFLSEYLDDTKMAAKKQNMAPMWKKLMKNVDMDEPTSFLDHVYLGCTQRVRKPNETITEQYKKMFESRNFAGASDKLLGWEKPHGQTVAWSYDTEGHARKCVERYCELTNKKVEQLYKVFKSLLRWSSIQGGDGRSESVDLKSLWQALGSFDFLSSPHKWVWATLSCGKQCTTMRTGTIPGLWLCRRSWRLKVAWSPGMERHAKNCVERYCELAIQKTTVVQSLNSLPGRPSFQGGGTGNVWRLSKVCLQIVVIKVVFVTNL